VAGRVLVVQHAPHSSLGAYGEVLAARGDETLWVRCHLGEPPPRSPAGFDAIVSLGAELSLCDPNLPDWVHAELRLLRRALDAGVPVWGICFGAQLLAAAAGGRVWRGQAPEVGFHPLHAAPDAPSDPVFRVLAPIQPMFHWHGDGFDVPPAATRLAFSDAYPGQAFAAGPLAYGVQFHAEATLELIRGWLGLPATRDQLERAGGEGAAERLLADAGRHLAEVNRTARALIAAWREAAEAGR
jgi:GMP synthase-like glutamine amidotransferase